MFLLPYIALPLYLLFGTRKLARTGHSSTVDSTVRRNDDASTWPAEMAAALGQPRPATYRALCVHPDGAGSLRALLEVIDGAQHTLDLCTFILGRDAVGAAVSAHLAARARAGVRVRLLLDGVGRMLGGRVDLSVLMRAGVQVRLFVPPLHSPLKGRTNLRNHHKLVVADVGHADERLWCGGRNLAAEYFEGQPGHSAWRDLSFDLQGALARQAADMFQRDWAFAAPSVTGTAAAVTLAEADTNTAPVAAPGEPVGQVIASGPDQADDTVYALLVSAA